MKNVTFKITDILKSRSMYGRTKIYAQCIEDGTEVYASGSHAEMNNNELVKEKLLENYKEKKIIKEIKSLEIGDIL